LCNREIKFGVFRHYAKRLGARYLATGHYARITIADGQVRLLKASDRSKDQSYFLHAVSEDALAETIFPLGELQKSEVRAIARDNALHVSDKKDSTGICFIGERPFREFLGTFLPASPGPMKDLHGTTIGQHDGLMYYTIGQRQGLGVGGRRDSTGKPWYVAAKDVQNNALIVVQGEHDMLYSDHLVTGEVTWIGGIPAELRHKGSMPCTAKVRYRQDDQACLVRKVGDSGLELLFEIRQRAVSPGQYAVFYDGETCLGGAVIEQVLSRSDALRVAV
jgi:tRNA-specific 2-thiouridylase